MKSVFILYGIFNFEPWDVLGTFDTREAAERAKENITRKANDSKSHYHKYTIIERPLHHYPINNEH